jgi:hypothetical protein
VKAGEIATTPEGTQVRAVGYQGGSGVAQTGNKCSGDYHYGWDNYYHLAQWNFSHHVPTSSAPLKGKAQCSVSVFSASWYSGAPDAQYALTLTGADSQTINWDPFNQNQNTSGWYGLTTGGQSWFTVNIEPSAGTNNYSFALTLRNGGGQGRWWYLAADAVHITCRS